MRSAFSTRCSLICVFLGTSLFSITGFAQEAADAYGQSTIRVSVEEVRLDVTITGAKNGQPVVGLQRGDFHVAEGGVPQDLNYLSQDKLPLSIVLMFDLTDTVRPVLKPLALGARRVLDHLHPGDEVAVMAFSSRAWLLQDFTTDRDKVIEAIEQASEMKSREATFLNEDMYEALQQAAKATLPHSRRVLVWLTDGTTSFPTEFMRKSKLGKSAPLRLHTKKEAVNALLHSEITVTALIERSASTDVYIAAQAINPLAPLLRFSTPPGSIRMYAKLTGGPVLSSNRAETADRLAALIDQIRLCYTLGYEPSIAKPAGAFCKISVKVTPDAKRRLDVGKLAIQVRRGYYRR